jgi:hypothetical protein
VTDEFPDWARGLHAYAGIALVLGCLIQKYAVTKMDFREGKGLLKVFVLS